MDAQTIIVGLIVLAAIIYAGNILRQKIKAFKPKSISCGADCGCESKKTLFGRSFIKNDLRLFPDPLIFVEDEFTKHFV
jgi:hypothetical protein